ncbi:helix-turn-helix transcriptional regulator [Treponema ruminis]|uniref:Putative DNA-binding transcriptional regulator YafY n=1 Tax=Treponema ruminis TaxID=744515 RepID=A0A7W8LL07_9SPIR|nr:WYL domain-containing protein [Treponema ruminis]MBB5224913.1 putative DNA-binding transcriptional regulator YafY [Treponema ruminis]
MPTKKRRIDNHLMLERLSKIHTKIKSGCYPNTHQLAYDNEVSVPTISRDIEFLRDRFEAPIEYDAAHRGYYYSKNFDMPLNMVSQKDLLTLSLTKQLLSQYEGSPIYKEISSIINMLSDSQGIGKSDFLKRVAAPPLPKAVMNEDAWNIVIECLQENSIIKFDYNGRWRTETTHRMLRPYQVLLQEGMYFVFGFDENSDGGKGGERLFNLSRMKNLENTGRTFELPEDFEFASRCGGGRFGAFKEAEKVKYEIDFYDDARQFVKDCIWADDQEFYEIEEENTTTICFSSSQSTKVLEWVLSQGVNAKPIAPESFVERWKQELRGMLKNAGI